MSLSDAKQMLRAGRILLLAAVQSIRAELLAAVRDAASCDVTAALVENEGKEDDEKGGGRQVSGQPKRGLAQAWGDLMQVGTVVIMGR